MYLQLSKLVKWDRNKGYGNYITLRIEYLLDAKEALKQKC